MLELYTNIKKFRKMRKMSQDDLAKKTGYTDRSSIAKIESGVVDLSYQKITVFAKALGVTEGELMGKDGVTDYTPLRIPVYGNIPAGIPLEMIEDIDDWEELPSDMANSDSSYFGLHVVGNSMYPKYLNGDTVIVRAQPDCENGQDCVVRINGDSATLKKVIKQESVMILQPINNEYPPTVFTGDASEPSMQILGVVVELRRKI